MIEFIWDPRHLEIWRKKVVESVMAKVTARAGNDGIRTLQIESTRKIRGRKRFKVGRVKRGLPLVFPTSKEIAKLEWKMDVSGAIVPLAAFPHRQTKKGVAVAVNIGQRKTIRSAFIATMKSGHEGIFLRKKGTRKIKEAFTTRISDVFDDHGFIPAVQAKAQTKFAATFDRLMALELARVKPR